MNPQHGTDLTQGSIPRLLIRFSIPMLLGSLFHVAYSFINAIWVGKFLGPESLAAVTVSFPVMFTLIAIGGGLSLATNILISQRFGAKDFAEVRRIVDSSTVLMGGISMVLTIVGIGLSDTILKLMGTPLDILPLASHYLKITFLGLPMIFGMFLTRNMLQGIGDSKTPLKFMAASLLLTAILDPLLMFGWLGFPKLGLNGTAWAMLISQTLGMLGIYLYLRHKKNLVALRFMTLQMDWSTAWVTIRLGIPSAIQQSLVSMGMVFITSIVNHFGVNAAAAFGAVSRIDQLAFMPAMTFGMAISSLAGQNIGAKQFSRVQVLFRWGCLWSGGVTVLASILVVSMPQFLLHIFLDDHVIIQIGVHYLRIVGGCYIFFAIMFASNGIINGAGHTLVTTIISLIGLWIVRVPLAHFLAHRIGDETGIWIAISVSFLVAMVCSCSYFFSGRWKKSIHRKIPENPAFDPLAPVDNETL